jgi:Domain of unknown function (DUF4249)
LQSSSGLIYATIDNAKVEIIEAKSNQINCIFNGKDKYLLPKSFKAKLNTEYQLRIILENGNVLESSLEKAQKSNPISEIKAVFKPLGIPLGTKKVDGHEIYLTTKDNIETKDYYLWRWKLFEKQNYCITCEGGLYNTLPAPNGRCVDDAQLKRRGTIYDYNCRSNCWSIFYNDDINIMSDIYSNGNSIENRLIAKVPFYVLPGSLIEVQQFAVSKNVFDFFNLFISQTQNTGTLADTPPAPLIGNMKNTSNSEEAISGTFMVSSKQTKSFWIDRTEYINKARQYGLLGGRIATPEPASMDFNRPPFAPCLESSTRTAIRPLNWKD